EDDDEDDYQPRKKKKKKQADDEGNSMMVRNIIGGVVLLVLLGIAAWVFYDKLKKKDDGGTTSSSSSSGSTDAASSNPRLTGGTPVGPAKPAGGVVVSGNRGERLAEMFRQVRDLSIATNKAMEAVADAPTGQAAVRQLRTAARQVEQFNEELKNVKTLTPAE